MGSKNRIAKHLLPFMVESADNAGITTWLKQFVVNVDSRIIGLMGGLSLDRI